MPNKTISTVVSIITPTYNQGAFIRRALNSLFIQTFQDWELIIINDGCTDYTEDVIEDYLKDSRVRYYKNNQNKGLGYCLNMGMEHAICEYIAYLPSDDIYYSNHIETLYDVLSKAHNAILTYSGLYYENLNNYASGHFVKKAIGVIPENSLQLVQAMHKKTICRWTERKEFVTGDLNKMVWNKLQKEGCFTGTNIISCEWVNHPQQRHKIISKELGGGLQTYKQYYSVNIPLRFYLDDTNVINEVDLKTHSLKEKPQSVSKKLKILIVGELGFNPDRLLAFEKEGHQLFALWISNPDIHNSIGPFSFGNITNLTIENIENQIKEIKPDIIYALLNTQAVKLAHYIMLSYSDIPFVWHFKEGPFFCRNFGLWKELFELYYNADGRIYINEQCKNWYEQFIGDKSRLSYVLDGDLPPAMWFTNEVSSLLSDIDGAVHTVLSGRPYGLSPVDIETLAKNNIHLHLYGEFYHTKWNEWVNKTQELAHGYLHLHPHCKPESWVREFSKYNAGWLHNFESSNNKELIRCSWDDLNYPARMSTMAAAGLPMIMRNNSNHLVASESLLRKLNIGIFFTSMHDLASQLKDFTELKRKQENVWNNRQLFCFDNYVNELIDFFKEVIEMKRKNSF